MRVTIDEIPALTRRAFPLAIAAIVEAVTSVCANADEPTADPWPKRDLMEPADLAKRLNTSGAKPTILCVAFPVLYRQRHIIHAEFAGPTSKPEGMEALKSAAAKLSKDSSIIIYCGCCPMAHGPNVRPAYRELKRLGYSNVRVLNIPTNFRDDWVAKNYPVEESVGVPVQIQGGQPTRDPLK
jgi:thiosulfate/3-mercaptopyruvate sulfurtransferase